MQSLDQKLFQLSTGPVKKDLFLRERLQGLNREWQKLLQKLAVSLLQKKLLKQPKVL